MSTVDPTRRELLTPARKFAKARNTGMERRRQRMTRIAIQEFLDGKNVKWMEKVTDEQYRR
jgi:hypothetical protein